MLHNHKNDTEINILKDRVQEILLDTSIKNKKQHVYRMIVTFLKDRYNPKTVLTPRKDVPVWVNINGIYNDCGDKYIRNDLAYIYGDFQTSIIKRDILDMIIDESYVDGRDFFRDIKYNLVPFNNGVFDLKNNKLIDYDDVDFIIFNKLKYNYNPNAKCPRFLSFLSDVLKDRKKDLKLMQEVIGNIFIGDYRFQKAVMLIGSGGNGKGTFLSVLQEIFKGVITNLDLGQITKKNGDNFEIVNLFKSWVNISADIGKTDFLKDTSMFKRLTGQDYIEAQQKRKDTIKFRNRAKLFLACNEIPYTQDTSKGFFRRWIVFEFDKVFEETINQENNQEIKLEELNDTCIDKRRADTNLLDKLTTKEEIEGIIKWGIDGAIRLLKNKEFTLNMTEQQIRKTWDLQANTLEMFCDKYVTLNENSYIVFDEFKERLKKFNPIKSYSLSQIWYFLHKNFQIEKKRKKIKGKKTTVYIGIGWSDEKQDNKNNSKDIFEEMENL